MSNQTIEANCLPLVRGGATPRSEYEHLPLLTIDPNALVEHLACRLAEHLSKSGGATKRTRTSKGSDQLAKVVLKCRSLSGLTQRGLADQTGLHYTTIQKIEQGERGLSVETLAALASVLGDDFTREAIQAVQSEAKTV